MNGSVSVERSIIAKLTVIQTEKNKDTDKIEKEGKLGTWTEKRTNILE